MEEVWKPIPEYEGWYEVSNFGNIRSVTRDIRYSNGRIRTEKGKMKSLYINKYGYVVVSLYKNQKMHLRKVHRLVGMAFLENPHNKSQINHVDGDKTNNSVLNLEWSTPFENQKHAIETGLRVMELGEDSTNPALTNNQVLEIIDLIDDGVPQRDIAKIYDVHFATISAINVGKSWSHLTGRSRKNNLTKHKRESLLMNAG